MNIISIFYEIILKIMHVFENFYFESFTFNPLTFEVSLLYSFDEKEFFEEKIFFPIINRQVLNPRVYNNILFHLHIAF